MAFEYKIILVTKEQLASELKKYQDQGWNYEHQSSEDNDIIKITFSRHLRPPTCIIL